ncbi:hypothetical protein [Thalassotalea fusca]
MIKQVFKKNGEQLFIEIFTIVIGILLALTIDEWVTDYKYRSFNEKLINEMYIDLNNDIKNTEETISRLARSVSELKEHISDITDDPSTPNKSVETHILYERNLFWDISSTKADFSLLQSQSEDLVDSVYEINTMQDAIQEHYKLMRQFLLTVCEFNDDMRIKCLEKSLKQREYLVKLLETQKKAYFEFKKHYEEFIKNS